MIMQIIVLFSAFSFMVSLEAIAVQNKLVDELSECAEISSDDQRLLCFDKLVQSDIVSLSNMAETIKPVVQIASVSTKKDQLIADFSKDDLKKTKENQGLDSITATIKKASQLIRGQWVLYLDNGQKWQQTDSSKIKLRASDMVRLQKGSLGVVYLSLEGSYRTIRVKRIK